MSRKPQPVIQEYYSYVKPYPYYFFKIGNEFFRRLMPVPYAYIMPDLKLFIKNIN